jgi:glycosyltransferase involved in cell wall biosynthesis
MTTRDDTLGAVVYGTPRATSAIGEYSRHLAAALRAAGARAEYVDGGLAPLVRGARRPVWILLQYNPFSYGHWGVAPGLVRDAASVRRRWPRTSLVVTVHEPWMPVGDWRTALMGTYQQAQLRLLLRAADAVIVVRETLARQLGRACTHVPVGSNVLPVAVSSAAARARLGVGDRLVVALLGTNHRSRALDHAEAAIAALARQRGTERLRVLNLGRDSPPIAAPPGVDVQRPGNLQAYELSIHLRAADVLLLPFDDGLSTRRSTLMAGLAHGLPVVGLHGDNTDRILVDHPEAMVLTPVGDRAAFARATVDVTHDRGRLCARGDAARRLYEREFDWPVAARRVLAVLRGIRR